MIDRCCNNSRITNSIIIIIICIRSIFIEMISIAFIDYWNFLFSIKIKMRIELKMNEEEMKFTFEVFCAGARRGTIDVYC